MAHQGFLGRSCLCAFPLFPVGTWWASGCEGWQMVYRGKVMVVLISTEEKNKSKIKSYCENSYYFILIWGYQPINYAIKGPKALRNHFLREAINRFKQSNKWMAGLCSLERVFCLSVSHTVHLSWCWLFLCPCESAECASSTSDPILTAFLKPPPYLWPINALIKIFYPEADVTCSAVVILLQSIETVMHLLADS